MTTAPERLSAVQLAEAYYVAQAKLSRRAADRVQALWRELDRRNLSESWMTLVGPQIVDTVAAAQLAAAALADPYVASVIEADGATSAAAGRVRPQAFAARAADGGSLESLLYLPVITTKQQIAAGQAVEEALLAGLNRLMRMAVTEVADAGRTATGVSIAGNRTIQGYIRVATPPACSRCSILAGKEFGWNAGFQRHPHCDCVHMPATLIARGRRGRRGPRAGRGLITDPKAYFDGLSHAEQNRIFTRAGAQAIRDGADITSVVNARRGMYTAGVHGQRVQATREGTTRRGLYFQREFRRLQNLGVIPRGASSRGYRLQGPRLTPESIYRLAATRDEAISLLRRYGYLD